MTQEPVQEGYSLTHPSSLVGLCVPYIVARSLQGGLIIYNSVSARCASKTKEALSSVKTACRPPKRSRYTFFESNPHPYQTGSKEAKHRGKPIQNLNFVLEA